MKDGNELLFLASTVRSDAHPAYSDGYIAASSIYDWSPDGKKILFSGDPRRFNEELSKAYPDPEVGSLWVYNPTEGSFQPLNVPFGMENNFGSPWSPDGQWIAGTGPGEGRPADCMEKQKQSDPNCRYDETIYIANVESGEVRRLTTGIQPVWSPDGSMLAFLSNISGVPEIWTVRIDGSHLHAAHRPGRPPNFASFGPASRVRRDVSTSWHADAEILYNQKPPCDCGILGL